MKETIHLSLLQNSHSFLIEAAVKAVNSENDITQLQFAIINLVQSLELSLKSLLHEIHPLFVYDNIDSPKHTISVSKAIDRLQNQDMHGGLFSQKDEKSLRKVIELRNTMTHADYTLSKQHAEAQFHKTFGLVAFFHHKYLKIEIEDIIPEDILRSLITRKEYYIELKTMARSRIEQEKIPESDLLKCNNCLSVTFVTTESKNVCYCCHHKDQVDICINCNNVTYSDDMKDFSDEFETDYTDTILIIHENYDYEFYESCKNCYPSIIEDIECKRNEIHQQYLAQEWDWHLENSRREHF